jgi:hypothetical protein
MTCRRVAGAILLVAGVMLLGVGAEAASCSSATLSGSYVLTFGGVTASGAPVSGLAGVVVEVVDIFLQGELRGSAVINQRGSTINILQEEVQGSFFVYEDCFLGMTLAIEPLGSLALVGFVHEDGRWIQFSSLFDPAVQITGVAHRR